MLIIHQKVAHAFRVLTASKPMKLNLMLQTWKLLVYVACFRKKNITVWRTLVKIVEKIKVTKLKYLITAWLHSNNPLQRKDARRKLVLTVAVLLKGKDQGRSQKKLMAEAMSMEDLWPRQSVHGWVLFLRIKSVYNRSSFSKQLGINCTCEQIKLFLISTRDCGIHSWKLLKSPICSRVQLIPNCFSNWPISYTN